MLNLLAMGRVIFSNRKVLHDFSVEEKLEAGIALQGWEVKSLKEGMADLRGAFVSDNLAGELVLKNANVPSWKTGLAKKEEEKKRDRKLLVHRREADKIRGLMQRPGYTAVPIDVYVNDRGRVKLTLAVVKGKRKYEKKQVAKEKDMKRQQQRELKGW